MAGSNTPPADDAGRFTFESDGFRYEVRAPLLQHEDYDTLWLAWCGPIEEGSAWASIEVLADRLLRFGPADVERMSRRAPESVRDVLHRALRLDPAERYQTVAEMRDGLRAYLNHLWRPFGPSEAAAELADIVKRASALTPMVAHPVELGVLPWPKATSTP